MALGPAEAVPSIEEQGLLHIRLQGFVQPDAWQIPAGASLQPSDAAPSDPEAVCIRSQEKELFIPLARPVSLPGSLAGVSARVLSSKPCTLTWVWKHQDRPGEFSCGVPASGEGLLVEAAGAPAQGSEGVSVWEGMRIQQEEGPLDIVIQSTVFHLWGKMREPWNLEVSLLRDALVYQVGEAVPMELLFLNRTEIDLPVEVSASVSGQSEESSQTIPASCLLRVRSQWPPLAEGLHVVNVQAKSSLSSSSGWTRRLAILPAPSPSKDGGSVMGLAGSVGEGASAALRRLSSDMPCPGQAWPMDRRPPEERLPWEGVATQQGEKVLFLGWKTPVSRLGVSEEEQSWYLAKAALSSWATREARRALWGALQDESPLGGPGLLTSTGEPKPALGMLARLASLANAGETTHLDLNEGAAGLIFKNSSVSGCALWSTKGQTCVAFRCSNSMPSRVASDGSLEPLSGQGDVAHWTLLPLSERPLLLVAGPKDSFEVASFFTASRGRPVVKPGRSATTMLTLRPPAGMGLSGRVKAVGPEGWMPLPASTSVQLKPQEILKIETVWTVSLEDSAREQNLGYEFCLAGQDVPLRIWSCPMGVTPLFQTSMKGTMSPAGLTLRTEVGTSMWSPQMGFVRVRMGDIGAVRQDFEGLRRRKPLFFDVPIVYPDPGPHWIELPCEISVHLYDRILRYPHDLACCLVPHVTVPLDGSWEGWGDALEIPLGQGENLVRFDPEANPDEGVVRLGWNEFGLVMGVRISDACFWSSSPLQCGDSLEFALGREDGAIPSLCVGLGPKGIRWEALEDGSVPRFPSVILKEDGALSTQVLVPWGGLGLSVPDGQTSLLFACGVNDGDDQNSRILTGWRCKALLDPSLKDSMARMTFLPK